MEIWTKSLKTFTNPWNSEQTPANMSKNGAQNNMKSIFYLFWRSLFCVFFEHVWENSGQNLCTLKNLPARTPMLPMKQTIVHPPVSCRQWLKILRITRTTLTAGTLNLVKCWRWLTSWLLFWTGLCPANLHCNLATYEDTLSLLNGQTTFTQCCASKAMLA